MAWFAFLRSLSENISLLEELLLSYKISPAIIRVCETKLNKNVNLDSIQLNKYTCHCTNPLLKAGGVGIYISDSIIYTLRTDLIFTSENYENYYKFWNLMRFLICKFVN